MSYRLISLATLTITNAAGDTMSRDVQVRAYPLPKRDPSGAITINGESTQYKRTGGKGRGTVDNRYMYAMFKGEAAYWPITEAEATALVGGSASLVTKAAEAPVTEPAKTEAPKTEAPKAERKNKNKAAA